MGGPTPDAARRGRLFRKYVVVFVGLVGGVLMASSLVELYFAYEETKRAIVRVERAKAVAAAAQIAQFVTDVERQVRETTRAASDDPAAAQLGPGKLAFRGGLGAALAEQRELDFFRLLRSVPAVSELGHLDVSGKEQLRVSRLSLDAVGSQEDFSRAPKFLEAKAGKTYWSPVYLRNGVEPFLTLAVPVGQYAVEVTTAEISLKAVQQAVRRIQVGRSGDAYVVDSRGHLFAHPDTALVRRNPDLSGRPQVRGARPGGPADDDAANVAEGIRGGRVLAAHAAIAPLGWIVLVERPLAEAYAPLRAPIIRSAVIFLLGLGLSVLASLALARRMVAPIRELQAGAARIGAGDLAHRIQVRSGDELETLGEAFNHAAAQLEESYATLERKVEARTQELADANAGLTEALEQQTATSEILRVIASSPNDIQPVLEAVVRNAARLCDASDAEVFEVDGPLLRLRAKVGPAPLFPLGEGRPINRDWVTARSVVDRATVHVPDLSVAEAEFPEGADYARRYGHRTTLATPLLRDGVPIGAILIRRTRIQPFSDGQAALLRTFADQAVIAIENVRLFTEREARNRELAEALEQQTATAEILRAISESPTDLQPVLDTVARAAARFCGATDVVICRLDGATIRGAAGVGPFRDVLVRELGRLDALAIPVTRGSVTGRAVVERRTVHVHDLAAAAEGEFPEGRELQRRFGNRTMVATPLLREGTPLGVIALFRMVVDPFSDRQLDLLRLFADQAVIAIENVRLFTELATRNRELTETLEQQTATAEILRVISSSPTDFQPVLDAVAESATRLCDAKDVTIALVDGDVLRVMASHGTLARWWPDEGIPITRGSVTGRAVVDRQSVHIHDLASESDDEFPQGKVYQRMGGHRTNLAVPLLREGVAVGVIAMRRGEVRPFTDKQVRLLETFADQAVIAIENVRLFTELATRNRELTETLEQQTATGEILRAISHSLTDAQPVFDIIAERSVKLCDAEVSVVSRFDGELIQLAALHCVTREGVEAVRQVFPMQVDAETMTARALRSRAVVHDPDVLVDPRYETKNAAVAAGWRGGLAVPMRREGQVIGVIFVGRSRTGPFSDSQTELLKTFADQAVIAIENVRLFTELELRNRDLTETLEQQTATSEILRVISGSPTDIQPVLDAVADSAARLCDASDVAIFRVDGDVLRLAASRGPLPYFTVGEARRVGRDWVTGRAVVDGATVHVHDLSAAGAEFPEGAAHAKRFGHRTTLATPLTREGVSIGAILVRRLEIRPFTAKEIELLKTFADQAVIAIENVRLFRELEARNRDLTETLEQQTATGEILRAISSSPTDVQPVFDTIVRSAVRLCDGLFGMAVRFDGRLMHLAAHHDYPPEVLEALQQMFPMRPDSRLASARAILTRAVVHIEDAQADPEYAHQVARVGGILAVPMLREGNPIGAIAVDRAQPGPFAAAQIELLRTFADQAVIAIENVRLFQELEARNRDLTETLEQQTATSEILRVISSSPTDVQPVFDTIAQSAKRLCEAQFCHVFRFDGERLHFVAHHGLAPEGVEAMRRAFPMAPSGKSAAGRSVLKRAVEHIPDVDVDPDYGLSAVARAITFRATLAVPMLREGLPVGAITVSRSQSGPFPHRQIDLLKIFADQAVIAIENVRLFQELDARTRDLTRSVGELRALGEVSQAVGSTLDLDTVLATIVSHAVELSGSYSGLVYEFDEATQTFHARAPLRISPEHLTAVRAAPIRLGEGAVGQAGVIREPVQVADIEDARQLVASQTRGLLTREGLRSLLAVPLVREGRLLGGLVIIRRERGAFSPEVVATLQTFAAQSVLAIHNARLFREIQRQKQYADALVETSPVAIVTMDLDGTVVGWNPGAERLFGYTEAEALGRPMEDLVATPEAREEVRTNIRQTLEGEWIRAIARRTRKDGTPVEVEISSVPVAVEGARVGMIGIYHDITELLRARREAEAANEAKSAFLATMSHEIRTPLNAVIGMSGLLLGTPLSDEQRDYAEIVRQSGDSLLTVINDVLDFSKIEAGKLELESQPFELRECVEGALDLVAARAAEKGLDLAYLVGDGTPAAVVGDVTRLRQVLLNLLSNAVKFTETGEVVLSVSARPLDGPARLHELTFSVRDTGIGIPPDRLGRLFQSFSQVDASTTRRYGGTGLGLAISQRLAELMGGRIAVTSEMGAGSEFRFTIRAAAADAPVPAARDLTGPQPSLRGKRVLVVDDNATNRRILATHLEAWGMPARATASPGEALAWVGAGERFAVAILDMHMPEMDGVALARALREHPASAALPLILFTSLGRREARPDEEGFAAYLHKPIKPSQLFDALVTVLAERPVHVRERATARTELDPEMARRHPLRILLAEDNVVNQKVALRLLGQMGYRADVAGNGLEAIDAVARQTYDVILMDVQMPELDGFEASREINRRWPGERRPRILAMTANAMQGDRELCAAAGMDDYVAKPIRVEELVAALERCRRRPDAGGRGAPAADRGGADALPPPPAGGGGAAPRGADPAAPRAGDALDRKALERLTAAMGGAFVGELIDTFIEDGRDLIATLRRSLAETDLDAFRRAAHSLKSTSETLGAAGLAALARELEAMARTGSLDGAAARLEPLAGAHEAVARTLGDLRRGLPA